jgi:hypothetical protein
METGVSSSGRQKQYAVFPLDRLLQQQLTHQKQQLQSPTTREVRYEIESTSSNDLANLDLQMKEILLDPEQRYPDPDTKYRALKAVLQRFLEVAKSMRQPFSFPRSDINEAVLAGEEKKDLVHGRFENWDNFKKEIVRSSGVTYKSRAGAFVDRLMQVPELAWNAKGELIVGSKLMPGSNIISLVVDAVKPHRTSVPPPTGWVQFADLIKRNNISDTYIGNKPRYVQQLPRTFLFSGKPPEDEDSFEDALEVPTPLPVKEKKRKITSALDSSWLSSREKRTKSPPGAYPGSPPNKKDDSPHGKGNWIF